MGTELWRQLHEYSMNSTSLLNAVAAADYITLHKSYLEWLRGAFSDMVHSVSGCTRGVQVKL